MEIQASPTAPDVPDTPDTLNTPDPPNAESSYVVSCDPKVCDS